jgi:hypothetical protein
MCDRMSCGCPSDYHMADCPILTDRYDEPPEPKDALDDHLDAYDDNLTYRDGEEGE